MAILAVACILYLNDYYHADRDAMVDYMVDGKIDQVVIADDDRGYIPEEIKAGFIFYPGGKVEPAAYEPLIASCASEGILCVLVDMPFNLAVFDIDAAEGIQEMYPEVENWYIGGPPWAAPWRRPISRTIRMIMKA